MTEDQGVISILKAELVKERRLRTEAETLLATLRERISRALDNLDSDEPVKSCAAMLELSCASRHEWIPLPGGRWAKKGTTPPAVLADQSPQTRKGR